jgi:hypothetical protein
MASEFAGRNTSERLCSIDLLQNVRTLQAHIARTIAGPESHLAGQHHPIAPPLQRMAENRLRLARVVRIGGIEEIDARVDAAVHQACGKRLVRLLAERHGAGAGAGYRQTGVPKGTSLHAEIVAHRRLPGLCLNGLRGLCLNGLPALLRWYYPRG